MEETYEDPNDEKCTAVYELPGWTLSECSAEEKATFRDKFYLMKTAATGDCLFHSIHLCLLTIVGEQAYTTYELRHAVAKTVTDKGNRESLQAMDSWKNMLHYATNEEDKEIQQEYKHAVPLLRDDPPFDHKTRQQLYHNMLTIELYWGDQYAIQVLERMLNVRLMILKKHRLGNKKSVVRGQMGIEHGQDWNPSWYGVLLLDGNHYMPLVQKRVRKGGSEIDYLASFRWKDIPRFVLRAFENCNK